MHNFRELFHFAVALHAENALTPFTHFIFSYGFTEVLQCDTVIGRICMRCCIIYLSVIFLLQHDLSLSRNKYRSRIFSLDVHDEQRKLHFSIVTDPFDYLCLLKRISDIVVNVLNILYCFIRKLKSVVINDYV